MIFGPPKPRFGLRVGITGHRKPPKLPHDQVGRIASQIEAVLDYVAWAAREIRTRDAWAFAEKAEPELRLVSSLARGADTIAADAALKRGWVLEAVLPAPKDEYRQDFEDKDALEALSGCARSVLALEPVGGGPIPDERYEAAGRIMLAHSDLLIGIWDEAEGDRGGTAQMIAEAKQAGLIVVLISSVASQPVRIWDPRGETLREDGGWKPCPEVVKMDGKAYASGLLAQQMAQLFAPPPLEVPNTPTSAGPSAGERLTQFYGEKERSDSPWIFYDLLRWLLVGRPKSLAKGKTHYGSLAARRSSDWEAFFEPIHDRVGLLEPALRQVLLERFLWADQIGLHLSQVYRSTYILGFTLSALAVCIGLLSLLRWHDLEFKAACLTVELLLIVAIVALTWRAWSGRWHQRWLDYRRLAELLRPVRMLSLVARTARLPDRGEFGADAGDRWVAWYVRATLRELGLPNVVIDGGYLQLVSKVAKDSEISEQIRYHTDNADRVGAIDHRIERIGYVLFVLTGIIISLYLVIYALEMRFGSSLNLSTSLKPLVALLAAAMPAIAAAFAGIRAQGDFRAFARQSRQTQAALMQIEELLSVKVAGAPIEFHRTAQLLETANEAMMSDLGAWRLIYHNRELGLPV